LDSFVISIDLFFRYECLSNPALPTSKGTPLKAMQAKVPGTMQKIVDFHMDESRDWVAGLQCGHRDGIPGIQYGSGRCR